MNLWEALRIALRGLRTHRLRSALTMLGIIIGVAAVILLVAIGGGWQDVVLVLVLVTVYQQVENYLLSPRLSARAMNIHPAVGFAAVIAGTALLGPVGAVLALPLVAIIQAFAGTYVHRHEVVEPLTDQPVGPDQNGSP